MININALFRRYFTMALFLILVLVFVTSNSLSTALFKNFMEKTYEEENNNIITTVESLVTNDVPRMLYQANLERYLISGNVEIFLYLNDQKILSCGPLGAKAMVFGFDQEAYEIRLREEEIVKYIYSFDTEEAHYDLYIHRRTNPIFTEESTAFVSKMQISYVILFIFGIIIVSLLSFRLSKRFNTPIITIKQNVNNISMGRYDDVIECKTKAKELVELNTEIKNLAIIKSKEDELRKRLTNDIAHELKTPISALALNLEAILDGLYEPNEERITIMLNQTKRLSRLVSSLSKLTLIESDANDLIKERVLLSEIVKDICTTYEPSIEDKKLKCNVKIKENVYINGNEDKLLQLFINLISNALKYTNEGYINIDLSVKDKKVIVQIEDSGIGIEEKDLLHVFERFYRSDESRNSKTGGAGIGLTIAKAIVSAHDGEIKLESQKGIGSKFICIFDILE